MTTHKISDTIIVNSQEKREAIVRNIIKGSNSEQIKRKIRKQLKEQKYNLHEK
ncbi:hypothetical protein [Companilactobacillus mishanensis]|uniref:hypothetical protein n=1 Tax=Companilactobacillus mishanensis TaxID=2486008 RepID=UPI00129727D8|nr:hypothetical protein [Companilactobacillus mishanensis]